MHLNPRHGGGRPCAGATGFTLVELLIAVAMLALLLSLAGPSFSTWIRNAQVRTVAETLQNGIRLAQAEAMARNRQTVLYLTNDAPGLAATPAAGGANWVLRWIPLPGDTVTATAPANEPFVQGGAVGDVAAGVSIAGPTALCFNPLGRRVANAATGVTGVQCAVDAANPMASFNLTGSTGSRALRVTVALGGQVRLCDPARALADHPDGCP
jgi:type IV fimbrial biogenesis protein FimT